MEFGRYSPDLAWQLTGAKGPLGRGGFFYRFTAPRSKWANKDSARGYAKQGALSALNSATLNR